MFFQHISTHCRSGVECSLWVAQAYKDAPGWANFGVINEIGSSGVSDAASDETAVKVIGSNIMVSGVADSSPVVV